jgi:uncharacterized protein (DUF2252 family)
MRVDLSILVVVLGLMSCKCGQESDPRSAWIETMMAQDHQDILVRAPELTEQKFRKMAQTPFNYFRGTGSLFLRDLSDPNTGRPKGFSSQRILLVGDPHPENFGTYRDATGAFSLEFNDFDAASMGPPEYDLWRLAVGFEVLEAQVQTSCGASAAMVSGYADGQGAATTPDDVIFADLVRRSERDGDAREELDDYTVVEGGVRTLALGEIEPAVDGISVDELVEPTPEEDRLIRSLMMRYPESTIAQRSPGAIKGMARRLGAGVASFPFLRFYVLTEGPTLALEDDLLLEVKETGAVFSVPGVPVFPDELHSTNGERVVVAQRQMQSANALDQWLGWASEGTMSFRIRERSKYQKGFDVLRLEEKFVEGDWTCADFNVFARSAGHLLGAAHRRVGGDVAVNQAAQQEAVAFAKSYSATIMDDYTLFRALVARGAWQRNLP